MTDDLRRARRNALDHLVENACLRAHACRDAEHKVRILSSTRRGLARLEWDACNHEAMRDHYFARATSLSKEDAALEEAAYVFAWFDVEHSGVLDTHEACPKFMLAFGCCQTWPEALVATRVTPQAPQPRRKGVFRTHRLDVELDPSVGRRPGQGKGVPLQVADATDSQKTVLARLEGERAVP